MRASVNSPAGRSERFSAVNAEKYTMQKEPAVSLALVVGVTVGLTRESLIDPLTIAAAVLTLTILLRFKINSTWLVLSGAVMGLLAFSLR